MAVAAAAAAAAAGPPAPLPTGGDGITLARVRLWCALLAAAAHATATNLARRLGCVPPHPLGWPPGQELVVGLLRTLFSGGYLSWRRFINATTPREHRALVLTRVPHESIPGFPPSGGRGAGGSCSWWVELKPELRPKQPAAAADGGGATKKLALVWAHGGAFVCGTPKMYLHAWASWLAALAARGVEARVFGVDYPLAPEAPFPAGLDAVAAACRWAQGQLRPGERLAVGGDSAGGNLAIVALAMLRDEAAAAAAAAAGGAAAAPPPPFQPPAALVAVSPAVDFTKRSAFALPPAEAERLARWDYIRRGEGDLIGELYLRHHAGAGLSGNGSGVAADDPRVSPVNLASFDGLVAPGGELVVVWGGVELMAPDIARFCARVREASPGVRVVAHEEPNEPHAHAVLNVPAMRRKGREVIVPALERAAKLGGE